MKTQSTARSVFNYFGVVALAFGFFIVGVVSAVRLVDAMFF
ncbi:MAG: hypothetical protein AAF517_20570 [Planctomycetota bacterium]